MTAKSAARVPSAAQLKQQLAHERAQNDNLKKMVASLAERMDGITEQLEEAKKPRTSEEILAQHNRSEKMTRSVLGDSEDTDDYPEPPPNDELPAHLKIVKRALAKHAGVSRTHVELDAGNEAIGQYNPRTMRSDGPASESLDALSVADDGVMIDNRRYTPEKLEYEVFMHEYVLVRVHDTTDETQIPLPQTINSGRSQYFVRGKPDWVRRLNIEPLARSKKTTYTQQEVGEGANRRMIQIPHTALMYPFEVLKDTPRGKNWLRAILAEPY